MNTVLPTLLLSTCCLCFGAVFGIRYAQSHQPSPSYPTGSCAAQIAACEKIGGWSDISLGLGENRTREFRCTKTVNVETGK